MYIKNNKNMINFDVTTHTHTHTHIHTHTHTHTHTHKNMSELVTNFFFICNIYLKFSKNQ